MEGFTIIDGVVAVVIILSALLAYGRGIVREAMAIAAWIAAALLAFLFAPRVEPLVREIPVVGEFLADSCELSIIGAFAVVFAVALIIVSLFTPLFSSLVQRSALGGIDQGLGFLFGVVRGVLLVAIAFMIRSSPVRNTPLWTKAVRLPSLGVSLARSNSKTQNGRWVGSPRNMKTSWDTAANKIAGPWHQSSAPLARSE
jgi:membrane protein required for colicin V production